MYTGGYASRWCTGVYVLLGTLPLTTLSRYTGVIGCPPSSSPVRGERIPIPSLFMRSMPLVPHVARYCRCEDAAASDVLHVR